MLKGATLHLFEKLYFPAKIAHGQVWSEDLMHGRFLNSCLNHLTISINEKLWVLLTTYSEPKPIQTQNPEDLWLDWEYFITYNNK